MVNTRVETSPFCIFTVTVVPGKPSDGGSNNLALAVGLSLVVILLIILAILGVLCGRHYLLRRSLQRFERSRYDGRSNSGMFSDLGGSFRPLWPTLGSLAFIVWHF